MKAESFDSYCLQFLMVRKMIRQREGDHDVCPGICFPYHDVVLLKDPFDSKGVTDSTTEAHNIPTGARTNRQGDKRVEPGFPVSVAARDGFPS